MATISFPISGDVVPASVAITSLTRADSGLPVSGLSLPLVMESSGVTWSITFTDPAGDGAYIFSATVTWPNGTITVVPGSSGTASLPPTAASMVAMLKLALAKNPAAVMTVIVDGQTIIYSRSGAIEELKFWQREAAKEAGTRPRAMRVRLDRSW
jgi:hypothetical protein